MLYFIQQLHNEVTEEETTMELPYSTCPKCHSAVYHRSCANCAHYHQHYVMRENGTYFECWDGHCTEPRIKNRKPNTLACERWEAKEVET